ncbi:hypothetical protein Tco_0411737 [Tanacetum coccineum]
MNGGNEEIGKQFGFVRFIGIKNEELLVKSLASIWIGNHHVYAAVARYQLSNAQHVASKGVAEVRNNTRKQEVKYDNHSVKHSTHVNSSRSYASIVHGMDRSKGDSKSSDKKVLNLTELDLIRVNDTTKDVMVKVKVVGSMINIHRICRNEGFINLKVHHIGGLWTWVQFENAEACMNFKANATLRQVFASIKLILKNFILDERVIWIEINGLPLCTWGSAALKKVASLVGKFMFFEVDQAQNMSIGRMCIATKHMQHIDEQVTVVINVEHFDIHISELATWNIRIEDDHETETENRRRVNEERQNMDDSVDLNVHEEVDIGMDEEVESVKNISQQKDDVRVENSPVDRVPKHQSPRPKHVPSLSSNSISSTRFARYSKKEYKGHSMLFEIDRMIEVGGALGYGVRRCRKSRKHILNGSEHYSSKTLFTSRNCPSREGMEGKSFEEGLAEITEALKRLQSTLLFHQTKLKESFRQARQDFSLARQDISLATEKLHISIKAAIKEEAGTPSSKCCTWEHPCSWAECTKEHYSSETLFTSRNCPSREGMKGKSFEEGLAEITETLKRPQSTLLFPQTKLKESFRQARQDFSLVRRDISLATEKLYRSIKAAIKEEIDHEEQFDFLGV